MKTGTMVYGLKRQAGQDEISIGLTKDPNKRIKSLKSQGFTIFEQQYFNQVSNDILDEWANMTINKYALHDS